MRDDAITVDSDGHAEAQVGDGWHRGADTVDVFPVSEEVSETSECRHVLAGQVGHLRSIAPLVNRGSVTAPARRQL